MINIQITKDAKETISKEMISNWLVSKIVEQLNIPAEDVSVNEELARYGLDSMDAIMISGELDELLDVELPSTLLWEYPTIDSVATFIVDFINNSDHDFTEN